MKKIKKSSGKKENKKTKKSESKEKDEADLEEELKKAEKAITHRLRETLKEEEVEKKDEEENGEQEFFEEPVRQFQTQEIRAPILERIIQREVPINNMIETQPETREREEREERRIDYSPASNQPNYGFTGNREENKEKKYESTFVPPVLSTREVFRNERRQEFLRPREEMLNNRINEQQLDDINVMESETRLPFEEQKKYKRFKLR